MTRGVRNVVFAILLCSSAFMANQGLLARTDGWSCGGVWSGCELWDGGLSDCNNCPIEYECEGYGGEIEYSECMESQTGYSQLCDCVPIPL
jgi:hypothetical protein